jgi:hypothetical protein
MDSGDDLKQSAGGPPPGRPGLRLVVPSPSRPRWWARPRPAALVVVGVAAFAVAATILIARSDQSAGSAGSAGYRPAQASAAADTRRPDQVVAAYLQDRFVTRDDAAAAPLTCKAPQLSAVDDRLSEQKSREGTFNVKIDVSWSNLRTSSTTATSATVDLDLTRKVAGTEQATEPWTFTVAKEGSWKVCAGRRTG